MGQSTRQLSLDLSDLTELVIKAMFFIVIVILIAQQLIRMLGADTLTSNIISIILGIAMIFSIIISKRIKEEIISFGKSRKSSKKPENQ